MSIKLDKKKWRIARDLFDPEARLDSMLPTTHDVHTPGSYEYEYDGEWIRFYNPAGGWPRMLGTARAMEQRSTLAGGVIRYAPDPTSIWHLLFERAKGIPSDMCALRHDGTNYVARTGAGGTYTDTILTGQDWSVETEMAIYHWYDASKAEFYINGALVHTETTNITTQPFEIFSGEPMNVVREQYIKYPPGIFIIGR